MALEEKAKSDDRITRIEINASIVKTAGLRPLTRDEIFAKVAENAVGMVESPLEIPECLPPSEETTTWFDEVAKNAAAVPAAAQSPGTSKKNLLSALSLDLDGSSGV